MKCYQNQPIDGFLHVVQGEPVEARYAEEGGVMHITSAYGNDFGILACKEAYARAVKLALQCKLTACAVDLSPATNLGDSGLCAALEGLYGGGYHKKFTLTDRTEPELTLYAAGFGDDNRLTEAETLARLVLTVRNWVNRPSNLLQPAAFADAVARQAEGLPIEVARYDRDQLKDLGLQALLAVGDSSAHPPVLTVLRYTGAPESDKRIGLVGKGVTVDSGGYCLKPANSMEGIKGDMAGGAACAMTVCALAKTGVKVNVTAVIPMCENRISDSSLLPGDLIGSLSGKTIEVMNTDAEGRLILADALTWAARKESCTHLVDVATLTGAVYAMLGFITTGVMAGDDAWFAALQRAAAKSGEKFWRMPADPEYARLIESDLADVRNQSKDGCGAITAGLFLKAFTDDLPWMHLDIAGTAEHRGTIWEHQVSGATGAALPTLYFLAKGMAE